MKKLNSQSGRSMVEMLGVLAIIGVLSVGGIAGYSLSMRRHRANQVADLVSKYALITYNQCQQRVLNGEATSVTECSSLMSFYQAGIGQIPAGVNEINQGAGSPVSTDATTGIDTVRVDVYFDDLKLCDAVGSVSGTGCGSNHVRFQIKQN